ncbi:hypothetical protein PUN28_015815 [Cardiocondyla obscurior]|uniref:Uncharacterized protein n=1 Tax=Cardiocondyla obscurior TaxID=286306 RepID=A0AAW2EPB8_9HYME
MQPTAIQNILPHPCLRNAGRYVGNIKRGACWRQISKMDIKFSMSEADVTRRKRPRIELDGAMSGAL